MVRKSQEIPIEHAKLTFKDTLDITEHDIRQLNPDKNR